MSDPYARRGLTAVAFLSITLLAACSHSPHRVETSRVEVPAKFMNEAGLAVQQVPAQALPAEWWTAYGDPLIDALVRNALEHNTDLAIARARIDEAVAITRRTRASMFPSLALTPQATRARDFSLAPTISSDARLPLSASWEVDLAASRMPLMAHGWTQLLSNRTGSRHVGRSPLRQCPLHCSSGRRQSWKIWQKSDFKSPSALSV
jgi:hypothetical protein